MEVEVAAHVAEAFGERGRDEGASAGGGTLQIGALANEHGRMLGEVRRRRKRSRRKRSRRKRSCRKRSCRKRS
jgi:hypothetical protein